MVHRLFLFVLALGFSISATAADEIERRAETVQANVDSIGACVQDCETASSDRSRSTQPRVGALDRSSVDRPRILVPLYASLLTLEALDAALTVRGIQNGASEANPAMAGVAGSPATLVAVKMGAAAASIFALERLRKRHPKTATALLVVMDSVLATVVTSNARFGPAPAR